MRLPIAPLPILTVLALAAISSAASAADWKEIDRLSGDIAIELDQDSAGKVLDGADEVIQATFRRQMPTGIMETDVAIDCAHQSARLRGIRLVNGTEIYKQAVSPTLDYHAIGFGSADAIYLKALCGTEIAPPEDYAAENGAADAPSDTAAPETAPPADGAQ